ncbi:MAG: HD domain-containing protein [Planctomycetota bacterium]
MTIPPSTPAVALLPTHPFSPLIEHAIRVAARAHRHDVRKGSDIPYLSHSASVALLLERVGISDDQILAAALLHDVVEDTAVTLEDLARDFPPTVVQLVEGLSERKLDVQGNTRPWHDRKVEHLKVVATATFGVRAIVLADKLHNLGTMVFDIEQGEPIWQRFNATRADILWYQQEMLKAADHGEPELVPLVAACLQFIERLRALPLDDA